MTTTPTVPTINEDFVNFMVTRAPLWTLNKVLINLSTAQCTAFTAAAADVEKNWGELADAKLALRKAQDNWREAKQVGRTLALSDVAQIKSFAAIQANPDAVFTAANIPAPKPYTPNQLPGQCAGVKANLNTVNGELKLTWACNNPISTAGTVYTIERRVGVSGPFTPLGLSSVKSFTDLTLPAASIVQYNITATRSGLVGTPSGPVSVVFGHSGTGETFIASVSTGGPVKMAA